MKNQIPFFSTPSAGALATLTGLFLSGCVTLTASVQPTAPDNNNVSNLEPSSEIDGVRQGENPSKEDASPDIAQQSSSSNPIAEGLYWLGNTGLGLEIENRQYRYYDEEGYKEWQPISNLTAIQDGVVFVGENYWCLSSRVPENSVGTCTADGWKSVRASEEPSEVSDHELSLGGIVLGDDESTIQSKLGQPDRIVDDGYQARLEYSGFIVWVDRENRRASGMRSTSDRYCTPAGVCPSLRFSEVREIYGSPTETNRDEGRFMEYYSPGSTCWLQIALDEADRVKSVYVACQP
jgi:hypothetical protein